MCPTGGWTSGLNGDSPNGDSPNGDDDGDGLSSDSLSELLDGSELRIAIACGRFNSQITERLLDGALRRLDDLGVDDDGIDIAWVPGAFELPMAARTFARSGSVDAVICIGAVIRGETSHYDLIAGECAAGLQRVQLDTGVPVVFGVLTTEDVEQALARSGGEHGDKGAESAEVAIEMVNLIARIEERAASAAATADRASRELPFGDTP
jgi:6,7-dimethyl-8-ribityllumazine synthase